MHLSLIPFFQSPCTFTDLSRRPKDSTNLGDSFVSRKVRIEKLETALLVKVQVKVATMAHELKGPRGVPGVA